MSVRDDFLKSEIQKLVRPGESVMSTGLVFTGPLFLSAFFGAVGQLLMLTHYYAILTNRRLILIQTRMGLMGLKAQNRGVTEFPVSDVERIRSGGMFNQRTLTLYRKDGTSAMIRFNSLVRQIQGHKAFCAGVANQLQGLIHP